MVTVRRGSVYGQDWVKQVRQHEYGAPLKRGGTNARPRQSPKVVRVLLPQDAARRVDKGAR